MRSLFAYPTVHASPVRAALAVSIQERLIMLAVLAASAIFLFADNRTAPIVLWEPHTALRRPFAFASIPRSRFQGHAFTVRFLLAWRRNDT